MKLLKHYVRGPGYALQGIWHALKTDRSFRFQVFVVGAAILLFSYFSWPLRDIEIVLLTLGWLFLVTTELQNTAFEAALDHLHPALHEEIGHGKDMASGAVMTAGFFLIIVMAVITFS